MIRMQSEFLPVIYFFGVPEDFFKSSYERSNFTEINGSVGKNKGNTHFLTYNDYIIAVFILLDNRLFDCRTDADNKNLRRND